MRHDTEAMLIDYHCSQIISKTPHNYINSTHCSLFFAFSKRQNSVFLTNHRE